MWSVETVRARLRTRFAPATLATIMESVRGTLRTAHRLGQMDADALLAALTATRTRP